MSKYRRILPSVYDDGVGKFKIKDRQTYTVKGARKTILLPNPRTLSITLHYDKKEENLESATSSHMVMQMGQFVDHDITLAPEEGTNNINICSLIINY